MSDDKGKEVNRSINQALFSQSSLVYLFVFCLWRGGWTEGGGSLNSFLSDEQMQWDKALLWAGGRTSWPPQVPFSLHFSMTLIKTPKRCWIWRSQTYPGNIKLELITTTFVNQNPLISLYGHLILGQKPLLPEKRWMEQTDFKTLFIALPAFPYGK